MKVAVVTDSTSDTTPERAARLDLTVVPLSVRFRGQVLRDGEEISTDALLEGVRGGAPMPSTSQPSPADFQAAYERLLGSHDHVLSLHIASSLSGTTQAAALAARAFAGRVTTFDSHAATGALAMMCDRAAGLLRAGASLAEVVATLERVRAASSIRFTVGTLEFLRRNGRIGAARALLGGLLSVKPLLAFEGGRLEPVGRPRGRERALAETLEAARHYVAAHGPTRAAYLYSSDRRSVEPLRDGCAALGVEEFDTLQIGTVIAAHVGPDAYGAALEPLEV